MPKAATADRPPGEGTERGSGGGTPAEDAAFEVRIEELRALVRTLVAEELERQLRHRSDCP